MFWAAKLAKYSVVLASRSQRRQELLTKLGIPFETDVCKEEEVYPANSTPAQIVESLAQQKAFDVMSRHQSPNTIVIGGDTIVCIDDRILGKPENPQQALQMLQLLSGRQHSVWSGLCVTSQNVTLCEHDVAHVWFKNLTKEEIDFYIQHFCPFDKAGAYGIQEWIGYHGITKIEGSFYTIMGFPMHILWEMMNRIVKQMNLPC
jgi:septum formation protein